VLASLTLVQLTDSLLCSQALQIKIWKCFIIGHPPRIQEARLVSYGIPAQHELIFIMDPPRRAVYLGRGQIPC
jgi:hypothetical protein